MTLRLGQTAPDFEQDTANGSIRFHAWLGPSWCVLLCQSRNCMPVVATEVAAAARLAPEWARRGVKLVCLSAGTAESHIAWAADIEQAQGCTIDFPMIADSDLSVGALYGMADAGGTAHGIFIIDPARRVRLVMVYPASTGCGFGEILRAIDSLQLADAHGVATPADWVVGQDVLIVPSSTDPSRGAAP
jgi:alkyl hydroperoxide reductase subunit AhpC